LFSSPIFCVLSFDRIIFCRQEIFYSCKKIIFGFIKKADATKPKTHFAENKIVFLDLMLFLW